MPLGEKRDKSVVIELDQLLTPENQRGKSARKHEIYGQEEGFGPTFERSERSRRPVVCPDYLGHPAVAVDRTFRIALRFVVTREFSWH
jgi:hypothetical protein